MAAFVEIVIFLLLTQFCEGQVSISSSVEEDGRRFAAPNEDVVFTCRVENGTLLSWAIPPLVNDTDPILFFTNVLPGTSDFTRPGVQAVVTESPGPGGGDFPLVSELTFDNSNGAIRSTTVVCTNDNPQLAASSEYLLASSDMLEPPERLDCTAVQPIGRSYEFDTFSVRLAWIAPNSAGVVDFDSYMVTVIPLNPPGDILSVRSTDNLEDFSLIAGSYNVCVSVMDQNSLTGNPVCCDGGVLFLSVGSNAGFIVTTVLAVVFFVLMVAAIGGGVYVGLRRRNGDVRTNTKTEKQSGEPII